MSTTRNVTVVPMGAQKRKVNNTKAEKKEVQNIRTEFEHADVGSDSLSAGPPSEITTENIVNHETFHGSGSTTTMTDEETLAIYTPVILNRLRGSKRDLARVGASLCAAKNALARGSDLSREQETTFTAWYEKTLGISQDQARLWMRWVRPVLEIVDWDNDDDPILNEIASIGPCLFDEVTKLPEGCWSVSDAGILFVSATATGTVDIPVKELSVRKVKAIRDRLNGVDEDNAVDDTDSDSLIVADNDLIEEAAEGDLLDDSDSGSDSEFDEGTGSDEGDEGDDDSVSNNVTPSTKKWAKSKTMAKSKAKAEAVKKAGDDSFDKLLNNEDWKHKDFRETKMPVLIGKTVSSDTMPEQNVTAINVRFALKDGVLTHGVVYSESVAFYAVKTGTDVTLHWYDHREDHWYEATVEQLPSEHHDCDEPAVEPQDPPLDTQDDLETGSCDLGDLDAYWDETDPLELEEQFDAYEEADTIV